MENIKTLKRLNMNDKENIKDFINVCILNQWILNISFEKSLEMQLLKEIPPHDKEYKITLRKLYMIYKKNPKIFWQIKTPVTKNTYMNRDKSYAKINNRKEKWDDGKIYDVTEIIVYMPFLTFKNFINFISNYAKLSQYNAMKILCSNLKIKSIDYIKALKNPNKYIVVRAENLTKNEFRKTNIKNNVFKTDRNNNYTQFSNIHIEHPLSFINKELKKEAKEYLKPNISFRIEKVDDEE